MRKKCLKLIKVVSVVSALYFLFIVNYITIHTHLSYHILYNAPNSEFTNRRQSSITHFVLPTLLPHSRNFIQELTARADADRYIILVMTDEAFVDMAINFYEASLRAQGIDNFLFVGVGVKTCEILTNMLIPCFYYADVSSASKASSYGEKEFRLKMNLRTDMILEALVANFTVIHTDTDVAFLGNPVHHVKVNYLIILKF